MRQLYPRATTPVTSHVQLIVLFILLRQHLLLSAALFFSFRYYIIWHCKINRTFCCQGVVMSRWRNGYRRRFLPWNRRFNSHQHDFTNGIIFLLLFLFSLYYCLLLSLILGYLQGGVQKDFLKSYSPIPILAITLLLTQILYYSTVLIYNIYYIIYNTSRISMRSDNSFLVYFTNVCSIFRLQEPSSGTRFFDDDGWGCVGVDKNI